MPLYEEANVSVTCVNANQRFRGSPQWKAPDGSSIGSTDSFIAILVITGVTRHQAGTYICYVPGIPEVPAAKFELVIHCKLTRQVHMLIIKLYAAYIIMSSFVDLSTVSHFAKNVIQINSV